MNDPELPTVYVGIPTGNIKEYASLYMLASLRNIYYPPEKLCINFAVTDRGNKESKEYLKRLKGLIAHAKMPMEVNVYVTEPTQEEIDRWGPYVAVIKNLHVLRLDFLERGFDYFWCIGGDNIVGTGTLRRLLELEADVAGALIKQRPNRGREFDIDGDSDAKAIRPMFWEYVWTPQDVRKRRDLEPKLKESLLNAWVEMPPMKLKWLTKEDGTIVGCNFGSGCELVKREVLECIGYYLGMGYHSEDIHFGQWANFLEFKTALNPQVLCAHFDPDGRLY